MAPKPKPGLSKESIQRVLARLGQEPDIKRILPQFQKTPIPSGPVGSTGAAMPMGNQTPIQASQMQAPQPATMQAAQMGPAAQAPPIPNPGMPGQPIGNAQSLLQQAKGMFGKPMGQPGTAMGKIPTGAAGIGALVAPNLITPFTPDAVDPYVNAAGQGAAMGSLAGPVGMAAGAAGGLAVTGGQAIGKGSAVPTPLIPALGAISPVGAAVALGTRLFGSEDKPDIPDLNYASAVKGERDRFFGSLKTMGIRGEDLRFLKTLYDTRVGGITDDNPQIAGIEDWTDANDPRVAAFYQTHQSTIQELTGLATDMFGQNRATGQAEAAEQTAYDRQQTAQEQLITALTNAQSRELQAQNSWMANQEEQYQAAIRQQQDFANTAQQWTADYLAPFQNRLQESAGNQAAYLQQQAASNPTNAALYNDLAQSVQFSASQAANNSAALGQLMPQQVYAQQVAALAPPNWSNYPSQGMGQYEQMIIQMLGQGAGF